MNHVGTILQYCQQMKDLSCAYGLTVHFIMRNPFVLQGMAVGMGKKQANNKPPEITNSL